MTDIVVATPWYPTEAKPYSGTFVRQWIRAGLEATGPVTVVHLDNVHDGQGGPITCADSAEGPVWRVPVTVPLALPRADAARAQVAGLTPQLKSLIQRAEVVMAHVIMPTGWAVAQVLKPGQRFVLVEHASYLPRLLADLTSRPMVQAAVRRAETVLCAGEATAAMLRIAAAEHRQKIWAVGNPIEVTAWPMVAHNPAENNRWLYVGNLLADKGVLRLVDAFSRFARNRPKAHLTVVGAGADITKMKAQLRRGGVLNKTEFKGSLDGSAIAESMAAADLLVHLSSSETFGLAPIEAVVSGLPVVASRTAGTSQTLTFAESSGRVRLVKLARGRTFTKAVVKAVGDLHQQAEHPSESATQAQELRTELTRRWGREAFSERLGRVYHGEAPYQAPAGLPLLVAALMAREADHLMQAIAEALWANRPVTFVTAEPGLGARQDPRVKVIDLSAQEKLPRAAVWAGRMVWVVPGLSLRGAARAVGLFGSLPGLAGRLARRLSGRLSTILTAWNVGHGRRLERIRFGGKRGFGIGQQAARHLREAGYENDGQVSILVGEGESEGFKEGLRQAWPGGVTCQSSGTRAE